MSVPTPHSGVAGTVIGFFAAAAIAYLAGAYSAVFNLFPYPQLLDPPVRALVAQQRRAEKLEDIYETGIWNRARFESTGLLEDDRTASFDGYTLLTRSHDTSAVLMDMHGEVIHTWSRPFREVWPSPPHTEWQTPESHIYWRRAKLFPNGDLLAVYTTLADTPYGYGLARLDRDSELLWKYSAHAHHDVAVDDHGDVYTITQEYRNTTHSPVAGMPHAPRLVLEDFLVQLDADGRVRRRVNLLEAIADSPYRHLLHMYNPSSSNPASDGRPGDMLHTNSVAVVDEPFAEHHPFADPGDALVSFRPLDAIALVSLDDERVTWMSRGFWTAQHDADPLPNGHILLFDNQGYGGPGGQSRIVEFDPASRRIAWSYHGDENHPFWSEELGAQQMLPNGHVLITSSQYGRVFEVNRAGEIVWHWFNPVRREHDGTEYTSAVFEATRIAPDELTFTPDALADR